MKNGGSVLSLKNVIREAEERNLRRKQPSNLLTLTHKELDIQLCHLTSCFVIITLLENYSQNL